MLKLLKATGFPDKGDLLIVKEVFLCFSSARRNRRQLGDRTAENDVADEVPTKSEAAFASSKSHL